MKKKILIISYYFPPCNLTASQRIKAWANYLNEFGYHPIIVTRNWDLPISSPIDVLKSSGSIIKHEKNDAFEVYYIPFQQSKRDRLITMESKSRFSLFYQKILTLIELFSIHFYRNLRPYKKFHDQALNIINTNNITGVIVSGAPFQLFKIGYLINKKFNIPWIADYRDDWSTNEVLNYNIIEKILYHFNKRSERNWTKNASAITSVSDHYTSKIANFTNKTGYTIENGFEEHKIGNLTTNPFEFKLIYNGTLYQSQDVETFLNAYMKFVENHPNDKIILKFLGAGYDSTQRDRLNKYTKILKDRLVITSRIEKKRIIEEQSDAAILVMLSHINCKGIPSSKLYEYFSLGKSIITYPPDNDIIDSKVNAYSFGKVCANEVQILDEIERIYKNFKNQTSIHLTNPEQDPFVMQQSRKFQVKKTAEILDKLFT